MIASIPKATKCLSKDKEKLLEFYKPSSRALATYCSHKSYTVAEKKWHRLNGYKRINEMLNNVTFIDGISEHEVDKIKQDKNYAA
ncbi:hypothetical protein ACP8HZ_10650 [Francisella noatunensis]